MSSLRVAISTRFAAQIRAARAATNWFGIPLLLLLVLGAAVRDGHPFEHHRIALDGSALSSSEQNALRVQFRHAPEVTFEQVSSRTRAESMLKTGMASAALSRESGRPALRVLVGGHHVLFGWGLVSVIAQPAELALVKAPRFGYLHFLLPGVITFAMLTSSLLGMGRAMRRLRNEVRASGLSMTWPRMVAFVASRTLLQGLVGLAQVGLLLLCARVLFGLPLGLRGAASLAMVSAAGLAAFNGVALAIAACVDIDATLLKIVQLAQLPLLVLSEVVIRLDELPRPLRRLGEHLPTTHLVRLLREVVLDGDIHVTSAMMGLSTMVTLGLAGLVMGSALMKWRTDQASRQFRQAFSAE